MVGPGTSRRSLNSDSDMDAEFSNSSESISHTTPTIVSDEKFFELVIEKCTPPQIVAACIKCRPGVVEIKGHSNSSSNFLSHLRRRHGQDAVDEYFTWVKGKRLSKDDNKKFKTEIDYKRCLREKRKLEEDEKQLETSQKVGVISQDNFEDNILNFIMQSMVPLRIVEDSSFIQIFEDLGISQCGLKLINCRTLCKSIEKQYQHNVRSLIDIFTNLNYVCSTVYIWSDRRSSFLSVTAHWIKEDTMARSSAALGCKRLRTSYTREKVAELISAIHREYGLDSKIIATVTNNSRNFIKPLKEYGVEKHCIELVGDCNNCELELGMLESEESDSEEDEPSHSLYEYHHQVAKCEELGSVLPSHIKCCANSLNLCATVDVLQTISSSENLKFIHNQVIAKCNMLWWAASRPKSAEIVQEILGYSLTRPVEARWNSFYDALKKVLRMKDKVLEVFQALNFETPISDDEFEYISEHLDCVEPIANALNILRDEKHSYYGTVVAVLFALLPKLENLCSRQWNYCEPIAKCLLNSVCHRFHEIYTFSTQEAINAAIAALSHPEYKDRWLNAVPLEHHHGLMESFKEAVSLERTFYDEHIKENISLSSAFDDFFDFGEKDGVKMQSTETELEVLNFFKDARRSLALLDLYPEIKRVFLKFNTPLSSSAEVERLFSYATMTNLPKSNKLTDKTFEMRVILKANSRILEHSCNNKL